MPIYAYANYAMGPLQVGLSFRVEPPTAFLYVLVSVLVYAFGFQLPCWMVYSLRGLNHWGLHHCSLLQLTYGKHVCNPQMFIGPHQECTEWLLPLLL